MVVVSDLSVPLGVDACGEGSEVTFCDEDRGDALLYLYPKLDTTGPCQNRTFIAEAAAEALRGAGGQRVMLVGETSQFRDLARKLAGSGDVALEIGSSYGDCLAILHQRTGGNARGIDISAVASAEAERKFPKLQGHIDVFNVLADRPRLSCALDGVTLAFVDMGGSANAEPVLRTVASMGARPLVIVIKCRLLYRAALKAELESGGSGASVWWRELLRRCENASCGGAGIGIPPWMHKNRRDGEKCRKGDGDGSINPRCQSE